MDQPRNLLTDVPGIRVGNAQDPTLASGVTVALFDEPAVASVFVAGGAPAGRDLECLEPDRSVERIEAIVLSGGSGFGLDAASGAQAWLRAHGRGLLVRDVRVPIVPSAVLFDLLNGGDKDWGRYPPYRELADEACETAGVAFELGTSGAGYGATTLDLKGGLGSASTITPAGYTVAALAAVNAIGSAVLRGGPHFWAAPLEQGREFGGLGLPPTITPEMLRADWKGRPEPATTLAIVATDASLTKAQAKRLATIAQGGLARGLRLSHAAMDGDTVFAVSTCRRPLASGLDGLTEIGIAASDCLARAIARGVHAATALPFPGALPSWKDRFGDAS
jgi:L-aminopeptidase/D-esterase-like protein